MSKCLLVIRYNPEDSIVHGEIYLHANASASLSYCSHSLFMHLKPPHLASVQKVDIFSASIVIQIAQCLEKHSKSGVKWRWNWVCEMYELAECKWETVDRKTFAWAKIVFVFSPVLTVYGENWTVNKIICRTNDDFICIPTTCSLGKASNGYVLKFKGSILHLS